jgi:hypothetical protein
MTFCPFLVKNEVFSEDIAKKKVSTEKYPIFFVPILFYVSRRIRNTNKKNGKSWQTWLKSGLKKFTRHFFEFFFQKVTNYSRMRGRITKMNILGESSINNTTFG